MHRRAYLLGVAAALTGCTAPGKPVSPTTTSEPPDGTVQYDDLSTRGKALFDRLLDETAIEVAASTVPEDLADATAVTFRVTTYPLTVTQLDRMVARYSIVVEPVFEDPGVQTVTPFSALSSDAQTAFQRAREDPSGYAYPVGERVPNELTDPEYVRYDGDPYEVRTVVADIPVVRLEITRPTT